MDTKAQDAEHLRLLSIFHYVVAGLAALFACLPVIHFVIGIAMISGWGEVAHQEPAAEMVGWFFVIFAGVFILSGWVFAGCLALAGRYLSRRRRYTYCLVMAGMACMFMPFGTVLGVFTIITLVRNSVQRLFGRDVPELARAAEPER
ncbi:MAG: hypothetical protein GY953_00965 [bacterium]|nr:hypothetical protein [bacterium]